MKLALCFIISYEDILEKKITKEHLTNYLKRSYKYTNNNCVLSHFSFWTV